ncbi:MAG: hypothetical protein EOO02_16965 [Chitinophagaceae bacterium]|nr:MAG: hypothetical protein EOO02_16965 [Chitinophagaceae bacterium]
MRAQPVRSNHHGLSKGGTFTIQNYVVSFDEYKTKNRTKADALALTNRLISSFLSQKYSYKLTRKETTIPE